MLYVPVDKRPIELIEFVNSEFENSFFVFQTLFIDRKIYFLNDFIHNFRVSLKD
jgi:hypothetical protein